MERFLPFLILIPVAGLCVYYIYTQLKRNDQQDEKQNDSQNICQPAESKQTLTQTHEQTQVQTRDAA